MVGYQVQILFKKNNDKWSSGQLRRKFTDYFCLQVLRNSNLEISDLSQQKQENSFNLNKILTGFQQFIYFLKSQGPLVNQFRASWAKRYQLMYFKPLF